MAATPTTRNRSASAFGVHSLGAAAACKADQKGALTWGCSGCTPLHVGCTGSARASSDGAGMKNATRTLIAAIAALIVAVAIPQVTTTEAHAALPAPAATVDIEIADTTVAPVTDTDTADTTSEDAPGIYGADAALTATITRAMARFTDNGLTLPALRIYTHDNRDECFGYDGLFNKDYSGTRIDICTPDGDIVLHELAHAWEHHSMDDTTRQAFMDRIGATVWNSAEIEHRTRAIERAADAIAWGLLDSTLTDKEANGLTEQLERFELLTGRPSPRNHGTVTAQDTTPNDEGSAAMAAGYAQMAALTTGK